MGIQGPKSFCFPPSTNLINPKVGLLYCAKFYQKFSVFFVHVAIGWPVTS